MTGKTHIIGGLVACQAADLFLFSTTSGFSYYAAGVAGALLPDICHTHSKIGRRFSVLSKVVATLFGHRTFTHSLLFLVAVNLVFLAFFPEHVAIQRGILIGMISHYFLDALTVRGIRFFYPADVRVRLTRMRTGGVGETFLLVGLVVCIGYLFVAF
ncbi:inner membrane protein [Alkalihalobacillus xiaoxiensis]|uniref:Inner membrane protein n=1 Tax=Shouchella xiaoxiensis TaxID=766895 RepID=A0ABS2SUH0_9BACI|nr:metal-dependent hydrolase [Shouchella xiaoxiensis]MBM7839158.1 inner membrane protein [Shouchella xiaoxiensis]